MARRVASGRASISGSAKESAATAAAYLAEMRAYMLWAASARVSSLWRIEA